MYTKCVRKLGVLLLILTIFLILLIIVSSSILKYKTARLQTPDSYGFTPVTDEFSYFREGHSLDEDSIKVEIIHDKTKHTSLNDDFVINNENHIVVSVYYAPYMDGGAETVLSKDFTNIQQLPFKLEIVGDLEKTFNLRSRGELDIYPKYFISAKVLKNSGFDTVVGDLVSEEQTPIFSKNIKNNVELKVFGLEECGTAYSGGFCTNRK